MGQPEKPTNRVAAFTTILMALFSSGLCSVAGLVMLFMNWNNPEWDTRVRLVILAGSFLFILITVLLGYLYRKQIN